MILFKVQIETDVKDFDWIQEVVCTQRKRIAQSLRLQSL